MREALIWILIALFCVSWLVGVVSFVIALVDLVRLPFNTKPEVYAEGVPMNPLNVALSPEKLSTPGLAIRHRLGWALVVFVVSIVVGVLAGSTVMLLKQA
jgi:hypothetical protein